MPRWFYAACPGVTKGFSRNNQANLKDFTSRGTYTPRHGSGRYALSGGC
jgi:hypothetical protein